MANSRDRGRSTRVLYSMKRPRGHTTYQGHQEWMKFSSGSPLQDRRSRRGGHWAELINLHWDEGLWIIEARWQQLTPRNQEATITLKTSKVGEVAKWIWPSGNCGNGWLEYGIFRGKIDRHQKECQDPLFSFQTWAIFKIRNPLTEEAVPRKVGTYNMASIHFDDFSSPSPRVLIYLGDCTLGKEK